MAKVKVPPGTQIQTLIFNKDRFYSGKKVKQWLHLWGFPLPGVALHETEDSFRVRQGMPGEFELGSFRTIELSDGIKAVVAKPKVDMASKKKKNSAVQMTGNPMHFPKGKAGRPRKRGRPAKKKPSKIFARGRKPKILWWVLDLYTAGGKLKNTLIGQGEKSKAVSEAQNFVSSRKAHRVELSGPYYFKPSKEVVRK